MDQPFRKKIILSEDISRSIERMDCFLHRSGYVLRVGRTGEEILDLARREPPDAVIINYYLPGPKGDEVCKALRRSQNAARLPILIVGPVEPRDIGERCREAGCDDYIASPATPNALLRRLAGSLGLQFRLHARVPAVISLSFGRIISEFLGYSKDISEGGILVETNLEIDRGRRLYVRIYLDERDEPLVTRATVLRVDRGPEEDQYLLGMQFHDLTSGAASRLRDYIEARTEH